MALSELHSGHVAMIQVAVKAEVERLQKLIKDNPNEDTTWATKQLADYAFILDRLDNKPIPYTGPTFSCEELRDEVYDYAFDSNVSAAFGDGQNEEYVAGGVHMIGLDNMNDDDLANEAGYTVEQFNKAWDSKAKKIDWDTLYHGEQQ